MSRDQQGRGALWVHQESVVVAPRCEGPAAVARLDAEWLGRRQLVRHVGSESGIPSRSEVAALGLHVARRLAGVTAGKLGEAGSPFGPAVLVQRLSGRGDVPVRQSRENLMKPGAPEANGCRATSPVGEGREGTERGRCCPALSGECDTEKWEMQSCVNSVFEKRPGVVVG